MDISEIIDESKNLIIDSLAFNIFNQNDAFRTSPDGKHISLTLFDDPKHLKNTTLKLLQIYLKQSNCKSVIGFTENDPSLIVLATQASLIEKLPFYPYDLENDSSADSKFIEPEKVPCSLIIPYSINENHVLEVIERFSQQKVPISQVISMIDENLSKTNFSDQDFEFASICNWTSLKDRICQFKSITNERMSELLSNFV